MGWTVLYIAFGIVALWLLGEVLLQYKARLRWRLLAFTGFLGVVLGVLLPSVVVIVLGAVAFAVGQTYVTLSFRKGFSTGWALGGRPGASRRRRAGGRAAGERAPQLEVTELSYDGEGAAGTAPARADDEGAAVHTPQPMPDDTGQYGIYGNAPYETPGHGGDYGQPAQGHGQGDAYAAGGTYDYGTGQQSYAAYSDPYIGQGSYDGYGQQYGSDPYAQQYGTDTPPGGVWVPQQRDGEQHPQPYDYDQGYGPDQGQQHPDQHHPDPHHQGRHQDDQHHNDQQQYRY
ncbi:hypothetical protein ABT160_28055 [Streptomyces sp. NPDC001941]|uniref:hypothetical protein n=1 Tax=Streptomyces sp. NPDC001941 TaxID=3154659 RepID=UPI0033342366